MRVKKEKKFYLCFYMNVKLFFYIIRLFLFRLIRISLHEINLPYLQASYKWTYDDIPQVESYTDNSKTRNTIKLLF
jgi:hypothetical protein